MQGKGEVMSTKERVPGKHMPNPTTTDKDGREVKTDQIKSAWRAATHSHREVSGVGADGTPRMRWLRREGSMSLKEFARRQDDDASKRWFHNKRVNTSNLPQRIGSTRKKKQAQGPKNPTGK